ncbi:MAG: XdhC/CoxI family protein [Gammaproteobacteria bacterium]|nr:XdhC/CoxI family protein [Gammaproteobacteria bacterium]
MPTTQAANIAAASGDDVLQQAITWMDEGHGVALAVVVNTWGSSPCPAGSQLAVNDKGVFVGSVSGGCIEPFVISEAIDVIAAGEPQSLEYGVSDEQAREVRLTCGGSLRVFVMCAPPRAELKKMMGDSPVTRVIDLANGATLMVDDTSVTGALRLSEDSLNQVHCLHKQGGGGTVIREAESELFVMTHSRPRKLIIIGAVHIAQILAPMATAIGFEVTVIDSRPAFARSERLPGVSVIHQRTEQAMQGLIIDSRTALAILAHDPILDDPALHTALESPAYYIGCLGSRRTHAGRLDRLREAGFDEETLERLHAPVGLDIGGRSAGEIAVSILAEIVAVGNGKRLESQDS